MKNGFIYPIFNTLVQFLFYCNLTELFKYIARRYEGLVYQRQGKELSKEAKIRSSNFAIDLFIVFKFSLLIFFWVHGIKSTFSMVIIYYLIFFNLFTYFYYHVWGSEFEQRTDRHTLNRKFLNSLIAIVFYILCYAYLYETHYASSIKWPENLVDSTNAIFLSIANAFTLTYGGFMPITQKIRVIFMSELINTFAFFTIIITNSIPNHNPKEKS